MNYYMFILFAFIFYRPTVLLLKQWLVQTCPQLKLKPQSLDIITQSI